MRKRVLNVRLQKRIRGVICESKIKYVYVFERDIFNQTIFNQAIWSLARCDIVKWF